MKATNTFGAEGLISRCSGSSSTFNAFDAQGSVTQRYTNTGSLVSSDLYDAFGKGTSTSGGDVFGYEGQAGYYTDTATGLILCGHRFYDSAAGRFINRDPIGYAGGNNLYGYVGNNASNGVDPSGLCDPQGDSDPSTKSDNWLLSYPTTQMSFFKGLLVKQVYMQVVEVHITFQFGMPSGSVGLPRSM